MAPYRNGNGQRMNEAQRQLYTRLQQVWTQQYSAIVQTERLLAELNPQYERRLLSRQERREQSDTDDT